MRRCLTRLALALLLAGVVVCPLSAGESRGPFESRDLFLPGQARLGLPAASADGLSVGEAWLRADLDWGSDFAWRQHVPVSQVGRAGYLIDGEHRTLGLGARRGLRGGWTLGVRLPVQWRGGGVLDSVIDTFHRVVTSPLGLNDNGRPRFPRHQLRIEGPQTAGEPLRFTGQAGSGLGKLELLAQRRLWGVHGRGGRAALAARITLPSGTGAFAGGGSEAALQLLYGRSAGARATLHAGLGGALATRIEHQGLDYPRGRAHGFVALERRLGTRTSLLAQVDAASRLLTNIRDYPGLASYLRLGLMRDLGPRWRLELGFAENLVDQQATTDFSIWLGLARRLGAQR